MPSRFRITMLVLWCGVATGGFFALNADAGKPGIAADAAPRFPEGTPLARKPERATLVLIAHPRCPCTRASLAELDRLMSRTGGRVDAYVVFSPTVAGDAGDLRRSAGRIAGVTIVDDANGGIAARFGAKTSGQVFVYGTDGAIAFAGGITAARGHEGDNGGARAALAAALGERRSVVAEVFGCGLLGGDSR